MTHTAALLAPSAKLSLRQQARAETAVARFGAFGLLVAGGLLSLVHSLAGSVGVAVLAAVIAGAVAGAMLARPELGYAAGAGLAAFAAFAGGFLVVGFLALAYGATVARSIAVRRQARIDELALAA